MFYVTVEQNMPLLGRENFSEKYLLLSNWQRWNQTARTSINREARRPEEDRVQDSRVSKRRINSLGGATPVASASPVLSPPLLTVTVCGQALRLPPLSPAETKAKQSDPDTQPVSGGVGVGLCSLISNPTPFIITCDPFSRWKQKCDICLPAV